jgi:SagB-type dehydrogenase family enzyme
MTADIGPEFMEKTRHVNLAPSPQSLGEPQPALELPFPAGAQIVALPQPTQLNIPAVDLRTAIERRRSLRRYSPAPLTLEELSYLLWMTAGVESVTSRPVTFRTVPSAGARHALETYLLVNRVEGLTGGLYRFGALQHNLVLLNPAPGLTTDIAHACLDQPHVRSGAVIFIWVVVVERMTWRYVQRGYRYLHLDAGHVCQNLYLAAEAIGAGMCAIAAYDDQLLNTTLGLDGQKLFAIYAASLGKKVII